MGKQNGSKTEAKRKQTRNQKTPQNSEHRTQKFFYGSVDHHLSVCTARETTQNDDDLNQIRSKAGHR